MAYSFWSQPEPAKSRPRQFARLSARVGHMAEAAELAALRLCDRLGVTGPVRHGVIGQHESAAGDGSAAGD